MWGLIQISGRGEPATTLLQSKVGRHGSLDHHLSHVETPLRAARRKPAVLGCRDGAGAVFRVDRAARGADGAGLRRGHGPKWFFVYNHLHTVHAIASCNAAEIAMGMLMEATVPTSHRWIPKAMNVQYLQKATTGLRAQARLELPDFDRITDGVGDHRARQRRRQVRNRGRARRHHVLGHPGLSDFGALTFAGTSLSVDIRAELTGRGTCRGPRAPGRRRRRSAPR